LTVLSVVAAAGCSSSAKTPADDPDVLHACSTPPSGPVSAVPRFHRAAAATCEPTPDTANPDWTYAVAGMACTTDEQCRPYGSVRGFCRNGACTVDECLIDADCGDGHVCICSSHTPNGVLLNANACLVANCRTDSDCGWDSLRGDASLSAPRTGHMAARSREREVGTPPRVPC